MPPRGRIPRTSGSTERLVGVALQRPAPAVAVADELVPVLADALADDGADHRVEAGQSPPPVRTPSRTRQAASRPIQERSSRAIGCAQRSRTPLKRMKRKIIAATVPPSAERVGDDQGDQSDDGEDEQAHRREIYQRPARHIARANAASGLGGRGRRVPASADRAHQPRADDHAVRVIADRCAACSGVPMPKPTATGPARPPARPDAAPRAPRAARRARRSSECRRRRRRSPGRRAQIARAALGRSRRRDQRHQGEPAARSAGARSRRPPRAAGRGRSRRLAPASASRAANRSGPRASTMLA